jgi:hypothetical protein
MIGKYMENLRLIDNQNGKNLRKLNDLDMMVQKQARPMSLKRNKTHILRE